MIYFKNGYTDKLSAVELEIILELLAHVENTVCWLFQSYGVDPKLVKIYKFGSDDGYNLYDFDIVVVFHGYRFNLYHDWEKSNRLSNLKGALEPEDFDIDKWTLLELDHPKNEHCGQLKKLINVYQQTKNSFVTNYHKVRNEAICQA